MSFKDFYKEKEGEDKELLEAYESYYLAESFDNGADVKITGDDGKKKILDKLPGVADYSVEDVYTYYDNLEAVPADFRKNRELIVSFGTKGGDFSKNVDGDITFPSGIRADILSLTNDKRIKEIFEGSALFSKDNVKGWLKEFTKSVEKELEGDEPKKYQKTILDYLSNLESKPFESLTLRDFKDNSKIIKCVIDGDSFFNKFKTSFFQFVEKKVSEVKGKAGNKDVIPVTDSEFEYILFGTPHNNEVFSKAYSNLSKTEFKPNRYFLLTPDETLLEIVYDENQPDTTPEKTLKATNPDKKGKAVKEYKKQHENAQVLGVFLPNAKAILTKVIGMESDVDKANPISSKAFSKVVEPIRKAISSSNEKQDVKTYLGWLESNFDTLTFSDFVDILSYAAGVSEFFKGVVNYPNPNVIFAQITKFVSAESKKLKYKGEEDYGKVSTVDFVVTDVDGDDLVASIRNKESELVPAENGSINVVIDGKIVANYFQVSLKTNAKTSSLGRNMELVKKKFGNHISKAGSIHESIDLLNEGIFDKLSELGKKGFEKLKELGKGVLEKIYNVAKALKAWASTEIKSFIKLNDVNVYKAIQALYGDLELNEARTVKNMDIPSIAAKLFAKEDKEDIYKKAHALVLAELKNLQNGNVVGNVCVDIEDAKIEELKVTHFLHQIHHISLSFTYSLFGGLIMAEYDLN
jgi:hypothetical protein